MKKIIVISVLVLLILFSFGLVAFSLNKSDLIFTGNVITHSDANSYALTRAYVSDKDEVANVNTILERINSENPPPTATDIAISIAEKGNIVFAPVFDLQVSTVENVSGLFMLTGSAKNGVDTEGNEILGKFAMRDLSLTITSPSIKVYSATNGFAHTELKEVKYIPVAISEDKTTVNVPFSMTNGFEVLFTVNDINNFTGIDFMYNYNVRATSTINMTKLDAEKLAIKLELVAEGDKIVPKYTALAVDTANLEQTQQEQQQ